MMVLIIANFLKLNQTLINTMHIMSVSQSVPGIDVSCIEKRDVTCTTALL